MATIIQQSNFRQDARFRKLLYTKDGRPIFGVKATPDDTTPKPLCGAGIAKGSTNAIRYDYLGPQFAMKEGIVIIFDDDKTVRDESVLYTSYSSRYSDAEIYYASLDKCKEWLNSKAVDFRSRINADLEKEIDNLWNSGKAVFSEPSSSTVYDGRGPFTYFEQFSSACLFAAFGRMERESVSISNTGGKHSPWIDFSSTKSQRGIVLCFPTCETGARLSLPIKANPQVKVYRNDEHEDKVYPELQLAASADFLVIPLDGEWTNEIDETRRLILDRATITRVWAASKENPTPWGYVDAEIEIIVPTSRAVFICADMSYALEQAWNRIADFAGLKTDGYAFLRDVYASAHVYLFVEWPYSRDTTFARPVAP